MTANFAGKEQTAFTGALTGLAWKGEFFLRSTFLFIPVHGVFSNCMEEMHGSIVITGLQMDAGMETWMQISLRNKYLVSRDLMKCKVSAACCTRYPHAMILARRCSVLKRSLACPAAFSATCTSTTLCWLDVVQVFGRNITDA